MHSTRVALPNWILVCLAACVCVLIWKLLALGATQQYRKHSRNIRGGGRERANGAMCTHALNSQLAITSIRPIPPPSPPFLKRNSANESICSFWPRYTAECASLNIRKAICSTERAPHWKINHSSFTKLHRAFGSNIYIQSTQMPISQIPENAKYEIQWMELSSFWRIASICAPCATSSHQKCHRRGLALAFTILTHWQIFSFFHNTKMDKIKKKTSGKRTSHLLPYYTWRD